MLLVLGGLFLQMMGIMETIGIVIDYPGLREMRKEGPMHKFLECLVVDVRQLLLGTDIADWSRGKWTMAQILSWNLCIGDKETNDIVKNVWEFIECQRAQVEVK